MKTPLGAVMGALCGVAYSALLSPAEPALLVIACATVGAYAGLRIAKHQGGWTRPDATLVQLLAILNLATFLGVVFGTRVGLAFAALVAAAVLAALAVDRRDARRNQR